MEKNLGQVVLVKDINPNVFDGSDSPSNPQGSNPGYLTEFDGQLYFTANDGQSGTELFVSDGTEEGTKLVKDIVLGSNDYGDPNSSNPAYLTEFNDRLYFTANDGQSGNELWATDGTSSETQLVADINPGNYDSRYSYFPKSSYARNLVEFNDKLYFIANDGESGRELFVSDGTAEGTQLLADIRPGINNYGSGYSSSAKDFTEFNDKLYFTANDGENGNELWVTDGTAEGTQLLVDLRPGTSNDGSGYGSYPSDLVEFNDKLYFVADNGKSGREIFVSDGTAEGTQLLIDFRPGANSYRNYSSYPSNFIEFNNKLYFTARNSENGNELFVSDGTAEGTQLLVDLRPGASNYGNFSSYPNNFIEFNNKLYFTANDGESGSELFVSDGTAEGTQLLADIRLGSIGSDNNPFPLSSYIRDFTEFNGKLYFTAEASEIGRELWVTDGTTAGTQLVEDLRPDSNNDYAFGSNPYNLTVVGDELFFRADNDETGTELFKLTANKSSDNLTGGSDSEEIAGLSSQNTINGGSRSDTLLGDDEDDRLTSNAGNDTLLGANATDVLTGGNGNDNLTGGEDNNVLDSGLGNDTVQGDNGNDTFVLRTGDSTNTIPDFNLEGDRLGLANGLQLDSLSFADNSVLNGDEVLATSNGIDTEQLISDNFREI